MRLGQFYKGIYFYTFHIFKCGFVYIIYSSNRPPDTYVGNTYVAMETCNQDHEVLSMNSYV